MSTKIFCHWNWFTILIKYVRNRVTKSYFKTICFSVLILDTQMVFRDEFDGLSILDVAGNMNRRSLVPNRTFTNLNAMYHGVSANQKYVWLAHDYYKVIFNSFFLRFAFLAKIERINLYSLHCFYINIFILQNFRHSFWARYTIYEVKEG